MPKIQVDPAAYASAAQLMVSANNGTVDAMTSLIGVLDGCSQMAGSDSGGQQWARSYDQQAAQLIEAGGTIANGLSVASQLMSASGANHAAADADSTPGGGGSDAPGYSRQASGLDYYGHGGSGLGVESISTVAPPSANGGEDNRPAGWSLVEHLLTYTWPNGHQDKLRRAATAWNTAAVAMTARADLLPGVISKVGAQQSPEVSAAIERCQQLQSGLTELATSYQQIGSSASEYAQHLDDTHHEIISELESLLAWTVASEATGALLTVFTAGISDAAAQGAVAARCAVAAERIGGMIGRLIETIGTLVQRIVNIASRAIEISGKITAFVSANASRAVTAVAERLPANELRGPVVFFAKNGATPGEVRQVKEYVAACNRARKAGYLSEEGRVSTTGALRRQASKAAQAERRRALEDGTPYEGVVGHAPDTTWTGKAEGYEWHDQTASVNGSLGRQAQDYPIGFGPTKFKYGGTR